MPQSAAKFRDFDDRSDRPSPVTRGPPAPRVVIVAAVVSAFTGMRFLFLAFAIAASTSGFGKWMTEADIASMMGRAVIYTSLGLTHVAMASGQWKARAWAWPLTIVGHILTTIWTLVSQVDGWIMMVPNVVIAAIIVANFFHADVKRYFGRP